METKTVFGLHLVQMPYSMIFPRDALTTLGLKKGKPSQALKILVSRNNDATSQALKNSEMKKDEKP